MASSLDPSPELRRALAEAEQVLFLCSGNMVRSTFAELLTRHLGLACPVASAATRFRNQGMFPETALALRARGVPQPWIRAFRSRHLEDVRGELAPRTLFLAMTEEHLASLRASERPRAFLFGGLAGEPEAILDPVLEGADFATTFERLELCARALVALYGSVTSTKR